MEKEDLNNEIVPTISNTERNSAYKSYMTTKNILHLLNRLWTKYIKLNFINRNYGLYFPGRCKRRNSESMRWKDAFLTYLSNLNKGKVLQCLILCGHYL